MLRAVVLDRGGSWETALPLSEFAYNNSLQLRKYVFDPKHVICYEEVAINPDLSYEEQPQMILDRKVQTSRNKSTAFVKIQWRNHGPEEATWELEDKMMELYPELFP
ncbi:uncharacterized protein LOC125206614 [Salvia hispanica]|uniref:uncharacterized protein LOC125206614 n=1 Tax=Salvia hispanica TaxID=49212 RepID=UPI0020091377|nr:uncharacterized protein LOC125206614 [Salvia hispanica]